MHARPEPLRGSRADPTAGSSPLGCADSRYGAVSILFHWTIAVLIASALVLAWWFGTLPAGADKGALVQLHKSIGITVLALAAARLVWRLRHPIPPYLPMPRWQARTADATHVLLYVMMFYQPLTGWLMSSAGGNPIRWFGLFTVPPLLATDKGLGHILFGWHAAGQWAIYALLVLHVGGALYHHFILRDGEIGRMCPAWSRTADAARIATRAGPGDAR